MTAWILIADSSLINHTDHISGFLSKRNKCLIGLRVMPALCISKRGKPNDNNVWVGASTRENMSLRSPKDKLSAPWSQGFRNFAAIFIPLVFVVNSNLTNKVSFVHEIFPKLRLPSGTQALRMTSVQPKTLTDHSALSNPNRRTALSFKIPGITSGLKPATSKSFIHRSGVISG